jgi:hypothetical protein
MSYFRPRDATSVVMGEGVDAGVARRSLAHAREDLERMLARQGNDPRARAAISSAIAFIEVAEARLASRPRAIESPDKEGDKEE